jgi:hypothetical protein
MDFGSDWNQVGPKFSAAVNGAVRHLRFQIRSELYAFNSQWVLHEIDWEQSLYGRTGSGAAFADGIRRFRIFATVGAICRISITPRSQ